ncbi:MAG: 4Fe-4S binding protein [Candidatus Methanofastidiosia archaeon]|jgi:epoxyqueuosine reductase QueG
MEKQHLRHLLKKKGADLVGFSNCKEYFPEYTSAITLGVSALQIYKINRSDLLQAMNEYMDLLNIHTRQILRKEGFGSWGALFSQEEFSTRKDFVPHRELAEKAGLGVIGKNFLLITPEYGPRIQLTTVLTTMPILPDPPLYDYHPCKTCSVCVRECPTNALKEYFDEELCIKCYECVTVCPQGNEFEKIKEYIKKIPNLWTQR